MFQKPVTRDITPVDPANDKWFVAGFYNTVTASEDPETGDTVYNEVERMGCEVLVNPGRQAVYVLNRKNRRREAQAHAVSKEGRKERKAKRAEARKFYLAKCAETVNLQARK